MVNSIEEKIAKEIANMVDYELYCLAKYHRNKFYKYCREHKIPDYQIQRKAIIEKYDKVEF